MRRGRPRGGAHRAFFFVDARPANVYLRGQSMLWGTWKVQSKIRSDAAMSDGNSNASKGDKIMADCPSCGRKIAGSSKHVGKQVKCPACSEPFLFAATAAMEEQAAREPADEQPRRRFCPTCNVQLLPNAKTCADCAAANAKERKCRCGFSLNSGRVICPKCGSDHTKNAPGKERRALGVSKHVLVERKKVDSQQGLPRKSESLILRHKTPVVECVHCRTRYAPGVNAVAVTFADSLGLLNQGRGWNVGSVPTDVPDTLGLIHGAKSWPRNKPTPRAKHALPGAIVAARRDRTPRNWQCDNCKTVQPYHWLESEEAPPARGTDASTGP
ncbi:MAG: hypothetical protein RIC55_00550 [Pirellulaceae bacterium]